MTIAVDCRMIDSSGVGAYLRGILPFFLKSEHNFLLLGNAERLGLFAYNANVGIIECDIKPYSIKELYFYPKRTIHEINKADIYFSPFFNIIPVSIPVFTVIHDIVFPDMPELTGRAGLAVRMRYYRRTHNISKKIFTVSEFSKSRIEHYLGKTKPVIVTHSAIQPVFIEYRQKIANVKKKKNIVFVGNIKKHKGLICLIDAFLAAKKEGLPHKLTIIGSMNNFRTSDNSIIDRISLPGSEDIAFTGHVSDGRLMEYLSEASLLVQPSLYEGFGLPPLEAMVLGTCALISDIPVFREIYNDFPVTFFRASDADDLKNKMIEILSNPAAAVSLPNDLVEKYNFQKTASIILQNLNSSLP
jgi:glycosyltransferase involved in cell wall biosynthesis